MANKKYTDFASQAPVANRLTLHADPVTGELKSAALSELIIPIAATQILASGGGLLQSVGGTPTSFINKTVLSALILQNGSMMRLTVMFQSVGADTRTVAIRFGTSNVYSVNATTAGYYKIEGLIANVDGSNVTAFYQHFRGAAFVGSSWQKVTNAPYTGDPLFNILLTSTSNNTIELYQASLELVKPF